MNVSVKLKDLEDEVRTAGQIATSLNDFLRLRMNIWTQQVTRWISLELWDKNLTSNTYLMDGTKVDWPKTIAQYRGRWGVAGIDLSSVDDLTCAVYMFPHDNDRQKVDVLMRTWCPSSKIHDQKNKYKEIYQGWERNGWIHTTDGNAVDYDFVCKEIINDSKIFNLGLIGIDRGFQGVPFAMMLEKELGHSDKNPVVITCTNHPTRISPACQEFERRLLEKKINHGGNLILRFMVDSVSVRRDSDGNLKPDKDKSQGKIDGVIGMLYALERLMKSKPAPKIKIPMVI